MKPNKIKSSAVIKALAQQCHISESSVRTVLYGLADFVIAEVAKDNIVEIRHLGYFALKRQRVRYQFTNRNHQEEKRATSVNPFFYRNPDFRAKVQAICGETPSYCHRNKEKQEALLQKLSEKFVPS